MEKRWPQSVTDKIVKRITEDLGIVVVPISTHKAITDILVREFILDEEEYPEVQEPIN